MVRQQNSHYKLGSKKKEEKKKRRKDWGLTISTEVTAPVTRYLHWPHIHLPISR
jgi:hypothetical protein